MYWLYCWLYEVFISVSNYLVWSHNALGIWRWMSNGITRGQGGKVDSWPRIPQAARFGMPSTVPCLGYNMTSLSYGCLRPLEEGRSCGVAFIYTGNNAHSGLVSTPKKQCCIICVSKTGLPAAAGLRWSRITSCCVNKRQVAAASSDLPIHSSCPWSLPLASMPRKCTLTFLKPWKSGKSSLSYVHEARCIAVGLWWWICKKIWADSAY